jgi:putative endonuclease
MERICYIYILASRRNGTLYTGITNDLIRRVWQHQNDVIEGFTKKYQVHRLVWFERFERADEAIAREKRIKKWNRAWKIALIEKDNPDWSDLYWKITHAVAKQNAETMEKLGVVNG